MTKAELDAVSEKIIGAAYKVSNSLGAGFLEKVYENALAHQLIKDGMRIEQQKPIKVYYMSFGYHKKNGQNILDYIENCSRRPSAFCIFISFSFLIPASSFFISFGSFGLS